MPERSPPAPTVLSTTALMKGLNVEHRVDGATYRVDANVGAPTRAALRLAWALAIALAVGAVAWLLFPTVDLPGTGLVAGGLALGAGLVVVGLLVGLVRLIRGRRTTIGVSSLGVRVDGRLVPWTGLGPVRVRQRPLRLIVENADGEHVLVNDPRPAVAEALLQRLERHRPGASGSVDASARSAVESLVADVRSRPEPD